MRITNSLVVLLLMVLLVLLLPLSTPAFADPDDPLDCAQRSGMSGEYDSGSIFALNCTDTGDGTIGVMRVIETGDGSAYWVAAEVQTADYETLWSVELHPDGLASHIEGGESFGVSMHTMDGLPGVLRISVWASIGEDYVTTSELAVLVDTDPSPELVYAGEVDQVSGSMGICAQTTRGRFALLDDGRLELTVSHDAMLFEHDLEGETAEQIVAECVGRDAEVRVLTPLAPIGPNDP